MLLCKISNLATGVPPASLCGQVQLRVWLSETGHAACKKRQGKDGRKCAQVLLLPSHLGGFSGRVMAYNQPHRQHTRWQRLRQTSISRYGSILACLTMVLAKYCQVSTGILMWSRAVPYPGKLHTERHLANDVTHDTLVRMCQIVGKG